jgi:hypothetical protein
MEQVYDSVSREISYNILTGFGTHVKLFRLTKMCLKTYCKIHTATNRTVVSDGTNILVQYINIISIDQELIYSTQ